MPAENLSRTGFIVEKKQILRCNVNTRVDVTGQSQNHHNYKSYRQ